MTPSRFQALVALLLDNLFDLATILVAAVLVVRSWLHPFEAKDLPELASWILAVLGLLAVSGLWDRNRRLQRIEKLAEESRDLVARRLSGKIKAEDFFLTDRTVPEKTLTTTATVDFAGLSLVRTTREYVNVLSQRLVAGATIRIIVLDPAIDTVLAESALRSAGDTNAAFWRSRIESAVAIVQVIAKTPGSKGQLQLGFLPYIPSFGMIMIDAGTAHGICHVELYHHKSHEANPTFELHADTDSYWYAFFKNQYEILWSSCRVQSLP
jgi:hypothetical protein